MEGERAHAASAYSRLVSKGGRPWTDVAVARFRVAEVAVAQKPAEARRQWLAIHRDYPAHPLAEEALKRAAPPQTTQVAVAAGVSPQERLRRAESLTKSRHWTEALDELGKVVEPAGELAPALKVERDYQIGMTKFQMRRDYAGAAVLLLGAAPALTGDKAASAAFHGARALSRVDRDDEAIAGYRKVVQDHPHSRYAAEAQYLAGWLEFNRGRFRESVDGLKATLENFGKSAFADDAAWCLAFAHYLLGETDKAAAGFERYVRMPTGTVSAEERTSRVAYWRTRLAEKTGRKDEARAGYRELARRGPLAFYGLLARARLAAMGEAVPVALPGSPPLPETPKRADGDPLVSKIQELVDAGMPVEAGWEAERNEKELLKRLGREGAVGALLDIYRRGFNFERAYQLAESRADAFLAAEPTGGARLYWEAAYPKAYGDLVGKYGPPAGNPDLLLYAIMRKESGFDPGVVSYADARGLLQMIPPTSAKVAAAAGLPFAADLLFEPETNVRLGALYIGALYRKFGDQVALTAGAYNAGPKAMARWCDQHGKHPMDEFVELIAFAQTREYVKRVVGIYARYRYLYGPTPYELPLTVDPRYKTDGPDY
jgi:soluble lytic murein transglycosylase